MGEAEAVGFVAGVVSAFGAERVSITRGANGDIGLAAGDGELATVFDVAEALATAFACRVSTSFPAGPGVNS